MSRRFKTLSGNREKFWQRVKVPVGIAEMPVAQIAREDQHSPGGSAATGLPALQDVTGVGMAQIVDSWRTARVNQRSAQLGEHGVNRTVGQSAAPFRGEEPLGQWEVPLTAPAVRLERRDSGPVQRNPTRLLELAVADQEQSVLEIHLRDFQPQRFGDA
jgi:hypothetical protein